jgi:hypothetical protein
VRYGDGLKVFDAEDWGLFTDQAEPSKARYSNPRAFFEPAKTKHPASQTVLLLRRTCAKGFFDTPRAKRLN